ncbi:fatty acyl-AMP ligase [Streptomyces sp. NEAU-S7GS2]|uniref:fatty acyl-AMP ligase n=1 Tax=Streptomyces sp. NEAU-S7GS2 TaxID=2202000 RepID=UPI000D704D31|nr:fatty acyl-AMP ligase [Streptomyces sp. NEAU-S7GS2]AWN27774.1 AMP-binding protein [Streptomyces sp. NEAU-S7GS2]
MNELANSSFTHHVRDRLLAYGDDRFYTFVKDGADGLIEDRVSYRELDSAARSLAAWFASSAHAGKPVLLLFPTGMDFLQAFLGCLYAGVIAVPAPVPSDPRSYRRVANIVADTGLELVLTTSSLVDELGEKLPELSETPLDVRAVDQDCTGTADDWRMPSLDLESVAFLQYTSGSTSEPKGVMVTQGNLLHNEAEIASRMGLDDELVMAGWLPHFHDMGLIGMLLYPLYVGGNCSFMAPGTFLKRPVRWLQVVSQTRANLTVAPNFAYDMCVRTITDEQLHSLDLSSLKAVLNGAEPVRAKTLADFSARFAPAGFRPEMFVPCYGMAEVTLLATSVDVGAQPQVTNVDRMALERDEIRLDHGEQSTSLVSCGVPSTLDIRIVEPATRVERATGQVGEIWIRGGSVAAGYWNRPDTNREIFQAHTADGDGPFLRTGDLGVLLDSQLYVTGRLKDVLILRGRNLYPQDIEYVVSELHPALAAGTGAVFSVQADGEHVVVLHEIKKGLLGELSMDELSGRISVAVARTFDIPAPSVVLTNRGVVQKTTSGKVQRRLMRELFLSNGIKTLHESLRPAVRELKAIPVTAEGQR